MRRFRPVSSLRFPQTFMFDYHLSPTALGLFVWCVSRAADEYDRKKSRSPQEHARVYPATFARTHGVRAPQMRAALNELCRKSSGGVPVLLVQCADGSFELADPGQWMFVRPMERKPLPRRAVFERDGFECVYCSAPVSMQTGRVDHVLPHSRGGADTMDNLATACGPCNARKHAKTPEEWLQ